jgi:hypothetical protein
VDEAFGGSQVTIFTEQELNRVTIAVDGAVQIEPFTFDLHVGLVQTPFARDRAFLLLKRSSIFGLKCKTQRCTVE